MFLNLPRRARFWFSDMIDVLCPTESPLVLRMTQKQMLWYLEFSCFDNLLDYTRSKPRYRTDTHTDTQRQNWNKSLDFVMVLPRKVRYMVLKRKQWILIGSKAEARNSCLSDPDDSTCERNSRFRAKSPKSRCCRLSTSSHRNAIASISSTSD